MACDAAIISGVSACFVNKMLNLKKVVMLNFYLEASMPVRLSVCRTETDSSEPNLERYVEIPICLMAVRTGTDVAGDEVKDMNWKGWIGIVLSESIAAVADGSVHLVLMKQLDDLVFAADDDVRVDYAADVFDGDE